MPISLPAPTIIYTGEEFPEIRTEAAGPASVEESSVEFSADVSSVESEQTSGVVSSGGGIEAIEQKGEGKKSVAVKPAAASPGKKTVLGQAAHSAGKAQSIPRRSSRTARVEEIDLSDILVFKVFTSYYHHLSVRIKGYMHYPPELVNEHKKGSVYVSFVLHRNGNISDLKIVESSGDSRFDKAALQAIQMSAPFPHFPAEIVEDRMTLFVPVTFSVD